MILVASIFSFFFVFFSALSVAKIIALQKDELQAKIQDRLRAGDQTITSLHIEKNQRLSDLPLFDQFLKKVRRMKKLQDTISQAGLSFSVGSFILFSMLLGALVFFFAMLFRLSAALAFPLALCACTIPSLFVTFKRHQRSGRFSNRFPDCIGLMASSLRAGHSLQMAIEEVVSEKADIVSEEFQKVLSEMEVGQNFEDALKGILNQVDTPELRLFVSAVVLQRETGGNLAELLDNLEAMIRERQELKGELRAATAQARFSGLILGLLPIFVGVIVFMIHPDYILFFFRDSTGTKLLALAMVMQVLGVLAVQKIVHIEL